MITIKLNNDDWLLGCVCGVRRQIESLSKGMKDQHGVSPEDGWRIHMEGACGELAFARAMNWEWDASVNTFKQPDVRYVQVRTTAKHSNRLIIRKDDHGIFALVTGVAPNFRVHGWFDSKDVKSSWLRNPHGREEAWFVPQSALKSLSELQ